MDSEERSEKAKKKSKPISMMLGSSQAPPANTKITINLACRHQMIK